MRDMRSLRWYHIHQSTGTTQPLRGTGSIIQERPGCAGLVAAEPPVRSAPDRNRGSAGKEQTGGK